MLCSIFSSVNLISFIDKGFVSSISLFSSSIIPLMYSSSEGAPLWYLYSLEGILIDLLKETSFPLTVFAIITFGKSLLLLSSFW